MKTFTCLFIVFSFFLSFSVKAQKSVSASFLSVSPEIDGIFEPEIWEGISPATHFIQMEPYPGNAASEKTEVFSGYTETGLYFVFKCYQQTPVVAKNQSRDALSKNDDLVAVILDTYNDKRSGYVFFANPLSTQIEMKINDDGRNMDLNWDTEWQCESAMFDGGWCVEFEIPFKSLKYKKNGSDWGINFGRIIRSNSETVYWSGVLSDDFRISQGGILSNIQIPGAKMKLAIFPYLSVFKTNSEKISGDFGGDINWQIGSNVSFNGTINPDFATVEADQQQINLTRYELSYPEKRLFFQEGNDMYSTRIKTFYSRRIKDIDFGERLSGKIGKTQFNVLNVKTPEFSSSEPATYFSAVRTKFDILNSSSLGLTLVDKSWNDGFTRSVSLDYVMNLNKTWKLTGQFVGSAPGNFLSHSAWFVRFARENNIYHYHIRYTQIGENFRENVNQTGFITDDDRREIDSDITYKWWLKNNTFEYINFQSMNNIFWSLAEGHFRSWYIKNSGKFYFKNKINLQYSYNNEYKLYEKEFYNYKHTFLLGYNTDEWSHALLSFTRGYNFERDFNLISGGGRIKLIDNLSLTYSANLLHFNPDPNNNSTFINVFTANYNFSKDLWIKMFTQNSTQNNHVYFYGLLGWRFKPPFGALYLIYSYDKFAINSTVEKTNNYFLKFTYPISLIK